MGVDCDESVVCSAATQSSRTGVEGSLHLGARRRGKTSVQATIGGLVRSLEVASLPLLIGVVADEEVPGKVGVLGDLGVVGWNSVVDVRTLVITSLDQEGLVASERKAGSERLDLTSVEPLQ
jgi:hypothetical protein